MLLLKFKRFLKSKHLNKSDMIVNSQQILYNCFAIGVDYANN